MLSLVIVVLEYQDGWMIHGLITRSVSIQQRKKHYSSYAPEILVVFRRKQSSSRRLVGPLKAESGSPFGRSRIVVNPHEHNVLKQQTNKNATTVLEQQQQQQCVEQEQLPPLDPVLLRRDRAILALYQQVQIPFEEASKLVEDFPQLYLECPNLATRIFYLQNQLGMSLPKIQHLLQVHPRLLIRVLLDNPEENVPPTVQVLQTELGLTLEEIIRCKFHLLDRMEVKKRITLLRQIFETHDDLKQIVLRDPTCLSSRSTAVTTIKLLTERETALSGVYMGEVLFFLRTDMRLSNDQIATLVRSYPKVLTLSGSSIENCRSRWEYILQGPIGEGLLSVTRRGIDPTQIEDPKERQRILLSRAQEFILRDFKTLLGDTLMTTTDYLVQTLHCSIYYLGRIAYRRPQIFQYQPFKMEEKVTYFLNKLELPHNEQGIQSVLDIMAMMPDVFTQSLKSNLDPKFDYLENDVGMSKAELRILVITKPQVLALALESNLKRKLDYLVNVTNIPLPVVRDIITEYPTSLRQPFDSHFKRRGDLLRHLTEGTEPLPCPEVIPKDFMQMSDASFDQWMGKTFGEEVVLKYRGRTANTRGGKPKKKDDANGKATTRKAKGE
jgi:hypothetical protein